MLRISGACFMGFWPIKQENHRSFPRVGGFEFLWFSYLINGSKHTFPGLLSPYWREHNAGDVVFLNRKILHDVKSLPCFDGNVNQAKK